MLLLPCSVTPCCPAVTLCGMRLVKCLKCQDPVALNPSSVGWAERHDPRRIDVDYVSAGCIRCRWCVVYFAESGFPLGSARPRFVAWLKAHLKEAHLGKHSLPYKFRVRVLDTFQFDLLQDFSLCKADPVSFILKKGSMEQMRVQ